MPLNIVTITGWGQQLDSLDAFASKLGSVTNIPYVNMSSIEEVSRYIHKEVPKVDVVIGWSLGAQIAARLVAGKTLAPRLLVLLAPAFQYVSGDDDKTGIAPLMFQAFKYSYAMMPGNTLRKFAVLMCQNDSHSMDLIATMDEDHAHHAGWIHWLEELGNFSCSTLDFSGFPPTLIFHGAGDRVTPFQQSHSFSRVIKKSAVFVMEKCGHAPHLHSPEMILSLIQKQMEKTA